MSSKNRRFRRKEEEEEDNADEAGVGQPPAALLAARKAKQKDKKPIKKTTMLSFDDEDGMSPVKAKERQTTFRPAESAVPLKQKARPDLRGLSLQSDSEAKANTQRSAAGEYSTDKLNQLRANAKSFQAPKAAMQATQAAEVKKKEADGGFKLSGSFKRAPAVPDDRFDALPSKVEKNAKDGLMPNQATANLLRGGKPLPKSTDDASGHPEVPSAAMIQLAKEKRERLRAAHLAPDYIPLGGAAGLADLEARLRPEGGLRAERDEGSGSDAEDPDQRMAFVGRNRNEHSNGLFSQGRENQGNVMQEEDDDDDAWIREQIRKGVSSMAAMSQPIPQAAYPTQASMAALPTQSKQASLESISLHGQNAKTKLQQDLQRLQMTRDNIKKQAAKTESNARNGVNVIGDLEEQLEAAGQKYVTLQKIKAYIADLCEMLQAKSAIVEEMQEHMFEAGKHQAAVYAQRCQDDDSAEYQVASASVSAAMSILSRGGDATEAMQSAVSAARHAEHGLVKSGGPQLDEFGRDISLEGDSHESERKFRLSQRNQKCKDREDEIGGGDTTDESDTEVRQYEREHDKVKETALHVFSDADQDFSTLKAVKARLEDWKRTYPEAYNQAHAPLSVPALFAPFVRNELLSWGPLFQDSKDFDRHKWYTVLENYGVDQHGKAGAESDDFLIPKLVTELICPIVMHAVQVCWNTFSRKQTKRLVRLLDLLLVFLAVEDPAIQDLYKEVTVRLESSIPLVKLPPWPAAALAASPEATQYLAHKFGKAVRLTANISAFDKFLPREVLQEMTFDRLFQQQMSAYLIGESHDKLAQVKRINRFASALPSAWFSSEPPRNARALLEGTKRLAAYFRSNPKSNSKHSNTLKDFSVALSRLGQANLL